MRRLYARRPSWPIVRGISHGLAAVFDGAQGALFTVILIALLVTGTIILVLNMTTRNRPPAPPAPAKWEPVEDDEPGPAPVTPVKPTPSTKAAAPRRKA